MALKEGSLCYYNDRKDPVESWSVGTVSEIIGGKTANVRNKSDGRVHTGIGLPSIVVAREDLLDEDVDDLLMLTVLHDATLLRCLKLRYMRNVVYTNIGAIVVALNPFNYKIPHYMDTKMPDYLAEGHVIQKNLPHSWSVANNTYWEMMTQQENQCILVSGESGAGKTEAAKIVLKYLCAVSCLHGQEAEKSAALQVGVKILQASPILEAFGNAKTVRNDNSSRFGKFSKVKFDGNGFLVANHVTKYLLEKSRIISASPNERVYHAFYQCVQGPDAAAMHLTSARDYTSIRSGNCITIDGIDDGEDYTLCREAMTTIGIAEADQTALWRIVAGILNFQNVVFENTGPDSSKISSASEAPLELAVQGFMVDGALIRKELLTTTRQLKGETITSTLKASVATDGRDALTKVTYDSIFTWLVDKVNVTTDLEVSGNWVGLLDIFGFEDFEYNSFEQVCINLANETLQNHYNTFIFNKDMEECAAEGIDVSKVECPDNSPCLELVIGKLGLFALLDEECALGEGSDKAFLAKFESQHAQHPFFAKKRTSQTSFVIRHYASDVTYEVEGFRDKNMDPLKDSMKLMMRASACPLTRSLIDEPVQVTGRKPTVTSVFKQQLSELLDLINSTNPHWIRCVKPHPNKRPLSFHGVSVMSQLSSSGVLGTVKIRKAGYPVRILFGTFLKRYGVVSPDPPGEGKEGCAAVLAAAGHGTATAQTGSSKVFLKSEAFQNLEERREAALVKYALALQRASRGWAARRRVFLLHVEVNAERLRRERAAAEAERREREESTRVQREEQEERERRTREATEGRRREAEEKFRLVNYNAAVAIQKHFRGMSARARTARMIVEIFRAQHEAQVERRMEVERRCCERLDAERLYVEQNHLSDLRSRRKVQQQQLQQTDRRQRLQGIHDLTQARLTDQRQQAAQMEAEAEKEAALLRMRRRQQKADAEAASAAAPQTPGDASFASRPRTPARPRRSSGAGAVLSPGASRREEVSFDAVGEAAAAAAGGRKVRTEAEEWERKRRKREKYFKERAAASDARMGNLSELYVLSRVLEMDGAEGAAEAAEEAAAEAEATGEGGAAAAAAAAAAMPKVVPLSAAQQAQLDAALGQLVSPGPNVEKWTTHSLTSMCQEFMAIWQAKPGDLLDELMANLVFPSSANAPTSNYILLLKACERLQTEAYGSPYPAQAPSGAPPPARHSLLTLLALKLLTQSGSDTDRLLTWRDAPPVTESDAYKAAYRERFGGRRNGCVYSAVSDAVGAMADVGVQQQQQPTPQTPTRWARMVGLLMALSEPLPAGKYGRPFHCRVGGQGWALMDHYRQAPPRSLVGMAAPLSCTAYGREPCGPAKACLLVTVGGAQEGVCVGPGRGRFSASQYPEEDEVLLPPFSTYGVRQVRATPAGTEVVLEAAGVLASVRPEVARFRQTVMADVAAAEERLGRIRSALQAHEQLRQLPTAATKHLYPLPDAAGDLRRDAFEQSKAMWQDKEDWKTQRESALARDWAARQRTAENQSTKKLLAEHQVFQQPPSLSNLGGTAHGYGATPSTLSKKQRMLERDYMRSIDKSVM